MSEKEKLIKSKRSIKLMLYLGTFYLLLILFVFIDAFLINKNPDLVFTGNVAIFFYVLILSTIIFITVNIFRLNNPKLIRRKAINDSDERLFVIHRMTGAFSFYVMLFLLFLALIFSVSINSIELFGFSIISIMVMTIVHTIIKLVLKKYY